MSDRRQAFRDWLGVAVASVTAAFATNGVVRLVLVSVAIGLGAVALAELSRMSHDRPLAERAMRVANRIRDCDPRNYRRPAYWFSSPHGFRANVERRLAELPRKFRIRRPYTNAVYQQAVAVVDELALEGYKNPHLVRQLETKPSKDKLDFVAREVYLLADRLYRDKHNIEWEMGK